MYGATKLYAILAMQVRHEVTPCFDAAAAHVLALPARCLGPPTTVVAPAAASVRRAALDEQRPKATSAGPYPITGDAEAGAGSGRQRRGVLRGAPGHRQDRHLRPHGGGLEQATVDDSGAQPTAAPYALVMYMRWPRAECMQPTAGFMCDRDWPLVGVVPVLFACGDLLHGA
jgi:hypothetical protein